MKRAFTLLEILVVIAIISVVAALGVSNFSFAYSGAKRPPKAVLAEVLKLSRISAQEQGEDMSLFFETESGDFVLRKTFSGEIVFKKNIFCLSEAEKEKIAKEAFETGRESEYPEARVFFYPNYPSLFNFTRSDAGGCEILDCLRFSPDGSSTPVFAELLLNGKRAALLKLDPLSPLFMEGGDE